MSWSKHQHSCSSPPGMAQRTMTAFRPSWHIGLPSIQYNEQALAKGSHFLGPRGLDLTTLIFFNHMFNLSRLYDTLMDRVLHLLPSLTMIFFSLSTRRSPRPFSDEKPQAREQNTMTTTAVLIQLLVGIVPFSQADSAAVLLTLEA